MCNAVSLQSLVCWWLKMIWVALIRCRRRGFGIHAFMFWREVFTKKTLVQKCHRRRRSDSFLFSFYFSFTWHGVGGTFFLSFFFIIFICVFCLAFNCISYIKSRLQGYSFALFHFPFLFISSLLFSAEKAVVLGRRPWVLLSLVLLHSTWNL